MARRKQVLYWCVLALLLAGWLYIAWNVPYTHDDWDWGLPEGLERWLSGTLNNRYAGTFFVLAMTRSQLVKTAVMGGCMFLISLLLGRLAGRGQPDRAFSVTVVTAACRGYWPRDALVDKKAETARLTKELEGAKKQLATAEAKLQNEKFISKAPQNVIDGVKDNAAKLREKVRMIEESLAALG